MFEQTTELSDSLLSEGLGAARCRASLVIEKRQAEGEQESGLEKEPTKAIRNERAIETTETTNQVAEPEVVSDDEKLVRFALAGDVATFSELIQKHYRRCLRQASFMLRNRADAKEEVQNACCKAFERLEQYRGEGTFGAWLGRIVENQCLMRIREERKSSFLYLDASPNSDIRLELVAQGANPEDEFGERQIMSLIRREISRIPPLLRNVMLLRDVEQLPMPEVASRLGVSLPGPAWRGDMVVRRSPDLEVLTDKRPLPAHRRVRQGPL